MRILSRLEITCLMVTVLILAMMVAGLIIRVNNPQDGGTKPHNEALGSRATPGSDSTPGETGSGPAGTEPESPRTEPNDANFSEQTRHIPNPVLSLGENSSTNLIRGVTPPASPALKAPPFGTNDVMMALQRIAAMPWSPASEQLLQETISKWAATDPTAALLYARQIESRRVRSALVSGIFNSWSKTDATAAYNWLIANKDADAGIFQMGLRPVFTALSAGGIEEAMKKAFAISGTDRIAAMRIVVEQGTRNGASPSSMTAYLESLQTPGDRQSYAAMLAQNWAIYAPQEAAQWALSLTDPILQKTTLTSTLGAWASDNPQAAADWVLTLPEGELRAKQIAQVTQSWARYDPVKAADWLVAQRPPAPGLDPAIQSLVGTVMRSNPEGAVMWAATISDPKLRNSMLVNASREWMKIEPQKASAYIVNAPFTPDQRARLLQGR